jgi:exodeoxyribonuclease VII large subunit
MTAPKNRKQDRVRPGIGADRPRLSVSEAVELHRRSLAPASPVRPADLDQVVVAGTVTHVRPPSRRGHHYFWLSDGVGGEIEVFLRRWRAEQLRFSIIEGQQLEIEGALQWYGRERRVQLVPGWVERIGNGAAAGTGRVGPDPDPIDTASATEVLVVRPRTVPALPRVIGLVTSATSAARGDVGSVIARKAPWVEVRLYEAPLEGAEAPGAIASAIERCGVDRVDLVLLARGGSSSGYRACDDLRVARAIAASSVPVVTAIGHAGDCTLACRVADAAYDTPTSAAEAITARWVEVVAREAAAPSSSAPVLQRDFGINVVR